MIALPRQQDAEHKGWLLRVLSALFDRPTISKALAFKGGTCAAMRGFLDRFSVDLDFDYLAAPDRLAHVRREMEDVFDSLGLRIKDKSAVSAQYFLAYNPTQGHRSTLKIDAVFPPLASNRYEHARLPEIDRVIRCQTRATMFANKLVALTDRWRKRQAIAGRDVYDIHSFFLRGFSYDATVITEQRPDVDLIAFFREMIGFVERHVTQQVIDQDLNHLLPYQSFRMLRMILVEETLRLIHDEIRRIEAGADNMKA